MSKARQLADLLDTGGDVISSALDNAPVPSTDWNNMVNKPTFSASATTDTTNASNISSGSIPLARLGSGTPSASTFLRANNTWFSACTTHANCVTSNCQCACACNC